MPNLYVSQSRLEADFGQPPFDGVSAVELRRLDAGARKADTYCNRDFFSLWAQTLYPQWGGNPVDGDPSNLILRDETRYIDVISVTSLAYSSNNDGVYDIVLVEGMDYYLGLPSKHADYPSYGAIVLDPRDQSPQIWSWPSGRRQLKLVCKRGYSDETEAAGTVASGLASDAAATTATLTSGHTVESGDTIRIESEDIYFGTVATNAASGLIRGFNGSTAVVHANATAIRRRRYPRLVEEAVLEAVSDGWRGTDGADELTSIGGSRSLGFRSSRSEKRFKELLADYVLPGAA